MTQSKAQRRLLENRGNCALWGCASLLVIAIVGIVVVTISAKILFNNFRDTYTDTEATELPIVEMEAEKIESLLDKVDDYYGSLENGDASDPLTLTEKELNALVQYHPELDDLSRIVYFTLEDDLLNGELSVPLDQFPGFGGRYFNGNASFDLVFGDDGLEVFIVEAEVKGDPVPEDYLGGFRQQNMAHKYQEDSNTRDVMDRIEDIEIREGILIITPKPGRSEESAE